MSPEADPATLLEELEEQERRLVFTRFDEDDAWALGCAMRAAAVEQGLALTLDVRRHGHQLFHAALPGTTPENDAWIDRKVRVVDRFSASSFLVGRRLAAAGTTLGDELGVRARRFAAHGGAFPVRVVGVGVVGTVTVSGLPQAQDHAFVTAAVARFLGLD